jgi:hypothetical protein
MFSPTWISNQISNLIIFEVTVRSAVLENIFVDLEKIRALGRVLITEMNIFKIYI